MRRTWMIAVLCFVVWVNLGSTKADFWGFYAHKLINRMAVFTLPPELLINFKPNLDAIEEYAVTPDKRRYSSKHEASRHYIDIDHWGAMPFDNVPTNHRDAVWKFADVVLLSNNKRDSLDLKIPSPHCTHSIVQDTLMAYYYKYIRFHDWPRNEVPVHEVHGLYEWLERCMLSQSDSDILYFKDNLDDYGILPYHLMENQKRLTSAFSSMNMDEIVRRAGEIGHYISDAHVPLHTTENYNGQLTGQDGIHAFWESRLPELFAEAEYDFWVGKCEYIGDKERYFWNIVQSSHAMVGEVLTKEKTVSRLFPRDQQYCFDMRLERVQRLECEEYAKAYQLELNGMVESQMRKAIHSVGSSWFTAWVDAGKPQLHANAVATKWESMSDYSEIIDHSIQRGRRNE